MRPVCSVCIANYNGMEIIDACIRSVKAQDFDLPFEIIVHDDASTDDSVSLIRQRHPDVRLIESIRNAGFCVSNNRMVAQASGEYILLLNNDAELLPEALSTLHRAAQQLEVPAILGLPQYDADTGELLDIGSLLDPFLNPVPNHDPNRREVGMVMGACLWVPKSLWEELGGFPEWFGSIGEDLYLCRCARLAGYPVQALGQSGYRHRVGASFGGGKLTKNRLSTTYKRRALSERNKTFVMAMTYPTPIVQLLLPLHLLLLLVEGLLLTVLRCRSAYIGKIYAPVFSALIQEHGRLMARRRSIMRQRTVELTGFFSSFVIVPHKLRMFFRYGLPQLS